MVKSRISAALLTARKVRAPLSARPTVLPLRTHTYYIPGGGKVDPDPGRGGWTEVEQEFGEIDSNFWSRIAAAWQPPRSVPGIHGGGRGGSPPPPLLPLVVNFGHGVGNAWRIKGEEVAVFRAAAAADGERDDKGVDTRG